MKFVATEDIAVPLEAVWARVSDLEGIERRAAHRVADLDRTPSGPPGQGTEWSGTVEIMGKLRAFTVIAAALEAPSQLLVEATTDGMIVTIHVGLAEMGPSLTRLTVTTEAKARSLSARLMLQSVKLARKTMAKRYKARVSDFASRVERSAV